MNKPTNPKDAIAVFKLPLHLVSPIVKAYQAISHYLGNVKYGAWNWREGGARASIYRSALDRHIDSWWEGEENDPIDGTPHLANAQACLNILIDAKHSGKLIDDRPLGNAKALAEVRAEFEELMPKIYEKYKDKAPIHYTREVLGVKDDSVSKDRLEGEWSEVAGGQIFVGNPDIMVDVRLRNGAILCNRKAKSIDWTQHDHGDVGYTTDPVAYRIVAALTS